MHNLSPWLYFSSPYITMNLLNVQSWYREFICWEILYIICMSDHFLLSFVCLLYIVFVRLTVVFIFNFFCYHLLWIKMFIRFRCPQVSAYNSMSSIKLHALYHCRHQKLWWFWTEMYFNFRVMKMQERPVLL